MLKKMTAWVLSITLIIVCAFPVMAAELPEAPDADEAFEEIKDEDNPVDELLSEELHEEEVQADEIQEDEILASELQAEELPEEALENDEAEGILEESATSGSCGEKAKWAISGSGSSLTLTISGSGEMEDYEQGKSPWYSQQNKITKIVINKGITSVGHFAFYGCSKVSSISLPAGLVTIGVAGFRDCTSLKSVTVPDDVQNMYAYAFAGCTSLTNVVLSKSLTQLVESVFAGCTKLAKITVPDKVTSINHSFDNCSALTSVSLPNGLKSLSFAFADCSSLKKIQLPDSITSMHEAFGGCISLEEVNIPSGVTELSATFRGCTSLTSISIPKTVKTIGQYAFAFSGLRAVVIPESVTVIDTSAFERCENLESVYLPTSITRIGRRAFDESEGYGEETGKWITIYYAGSKSQWEANEFDDDIDSAYVKVVFNANNVEITSIKLISSINLKYGATSQLQPTISPSNATIKDITWSSSNPKVVSVDSNGKITSVSVGKATITAVTMNGKRASCTVQSMFKDVTDSSKAQFDAIYWGNSKGIIAGYSDGTFRPDNSCTRGQVVMFLWRAAGKPEPGSGAVKFSDVSSSHPYYKAILWANQKGIAAGFSNGTFKPDDSCTRGQIVTFLWRYKGKPAAKSGASTFKDVPSNHKYYSAIMWASSYGITTGFTDGTFRPDNTCTRGQCATFLYRLLK